MNKLDKILLILAIFLFLFVGFMCVTFWKFQSTPDTLIIAVLGSGGIECIITGFITISNIKKGKNNED